MTFRTAAPNKLDTIAATMRQHIETAGAAYSHQRLARGLEIVLQHKFERTGVQRWRLALARSDVTPSTDEIDICRRAFGVPDASEHTARAIERKGKTGLTSTWHIVEMYWYEA